MNLGGASGYPAPVVGQQGLTSTPTAQGGFSTGTNFGLLNQTTANSGFTFKLDEKYVNAALQALATDTKVDVLSRPYILTSDNQEATIMAGTNYPFITNSVIDSTGTVTNTVEYQAIGVILDVTPHINPDGLVTMDIYPEISGLGSANVQLNTNVYSPSFDQTYSQSHVAIRDGQTIVIGGMMQDSINKTVTKIPFLGDIPLIGLLFQSIGPQTKVKKELLIFLTPHVAKQPDELKGMTDSEKSGTKIVHDAVEPGAYKSHLHGMELGAASRPTSGPSTNPADTSVFIPDAAHTVQPDPGESTTRPADPPATKPADSTTTRPAAQSSTTRSAYEPTTRTAAATGNR